MHAHRIWSIESGFLNPNSYSPRLLFGINRMVNKSVFCSCYFRCHQRWPWEEDINQNPSGKDCLTFDRICRMIQVGFVCISLSTPTPESVKYPIVADSWDLPGKCSSVLWHYSFIYLCIYFWQPQDFCFSQVPNCCPELIGSPVDTRNSSVIQNHINSYT